MPSSGVLISSEDGGYIQSLNADPGPDFNAKAPRTGNF